MSGAISSLLAPLFGGGAAGLLFAGRQVAAITLSGVAIKLLDDYLDGQEADELRSLPAYALLALSVAVALAPGPALSLFLAAYAVGMLKDLAVPFPAGLVGWQEVALVLLGGLLLTGWREMLGSVALMVAAQSADDLFDWGLDRAHGRPSLVGRLGLGECAFLLLFTAALGWSLAPGKAALVACTAAGIWWAERALAGQRAGVAEQAVVEKR
ncbi:MAG: hypothetical protein ACYC6V_00530 [Bacillota bacterium]